MKTHWDFVCCLAQASLSECKINVFMKLIINIKIYKNKHSLHMQLKQMINQEVT